MNEAATSVDDKNVTYEGCGKEGPIRSVFMAEFDVHEGPRIRCQAPYDGSDLINEDTFEAVRDFIIPKPELALQNITLNVLGHKICGYPTILKDDRKYKRNHFMFNVCFNCHPWSRTVQYDQVLVKLSKFLVDLELESNFLSDEENTDELQVLLEQVFKDLNETGECTVKVRDLSLLRLKVIPNREDPPTIHDWDVPVLMMDLNSMSADSESEKGKLKLQSDDWDLTTKKILPFFNGVNHVSRIAMEAGVETNLVKVAVQNLVYHRLLQIVPIFMYSNEYCATTTINDLRTDMDLQKRFMDFILYSKDGEKPKFNDVIRMVCDFNRNTSVVDVVAKHNPRIKMNVDERKLVQYLVHKKLLRRVLKYPYYVTDSNPNLNLFGASYSTGVKGAASDLYHLFTGKAHFDEICCKASIGVKKLNELIDADPNVFVIRS